MSWRSKQASERTRGGPDGHTPGTRAPPTFSRPRGLRSNRERRHVDNNQASQQPTKRTKAQNDQDFRPSLSTIYNTYTHTHTLSLIATYVTGVRSTRTSRTHPGPDREDAVNYNSYNKYILISLRFDVSEVINI